MTEWKPGDVVTATVKGRENVRLVAGWSKYDPRLRWCEMSPRWGDGDDDDCWFVPRDVTDARPLVVIDAEDREQVERLAQAYLDKFGSGHPSQAIADQMQLALREFANPTRPKPDQRTQPFAVVQDSNGARWLLASDADGLAPWNRIGTDVWAAWSEISAVRVLSEGA